MNDRFDLFGPAHKGLRRALFAATEVVARTDFTDAAAVMATAAEVLRVLSLLAEHGGHEERAILPLLLCCAPVLHADLGAEHARLQGQQAELHFLVERLSGAGGLERQAIGLRLQQRLPLLVADQLRHMAREEGEVNRMLWAHHGDDALRQVQEAMLDAVAPARRAEWLALILPAVHPGERRRLLSGLRATLPAAAFEGLTGPARAELGDDAFRQAVGA